MVKQLASDGVVPAVRVRALEVEHEKWTRNASQSEQEAVIRNQTGRMNRSTNAPVPQVDAFLARSALEMLPIASPHLLRGVTTDTASHSDSGRSTSDIWDGYDEQTFSVFCYT